MEVQAKIIKIGANALAENDPLVILFDPQVTATLADVAVIQAFASKSDQGQLNLQAGSTIVIDSRDFQVHQVGQLVQPNLTTIGHVTLIFKVPGPDDKMQSAIYLTSTSPEKPAFHVGDVITYRF